MKLSLLLQALHKTRLIFNIYPKFSKNVKPCDVAVDEELHYWKHQVPGVIFKIEYIGSWRLESQDSWTTLLFSPNSACFIKRVLSLNRDTSILLIFFEQV